jgi:hypothetical protein
MESILPFLNDIQAQVDFGIWKTNHNQQIIKSANQQISK